MKTHIAFFAYAILALTIPLFAESKSEKFEADIPYTAQTDAYAKERCKLDIYVPKDKIAATVVWFHGGGLSGGNKNFPDGLKNSGLIVVAPNYRLSPKIPAHLAINDAAEAVAWVFANIEKYGGSPDKIFVGGHSAGAYLSGMISFAPEYLAKYKIKNTDIKGCILLSGQTTTHFRVRKDFGDTDSQWLPKIDKYSLIGNADNKIPPCCLIVGDPALEFPERVEENILLASVLKKLNSSPKVCLYQLQGLDHTTVSSAIAPILKNFIRSF